MLILGAFFTIPRTILQMHKEHMATSYEYWRGNGIINVEAVC